MIHPSHSQLFLSHPDHLDNAVIVAELEDFASAREISSYLQKRHFPAEALRIVADGLSFIDRIAIKSSAFQAGLQGAFRGATLGLFIGFVVGIIGVSVPTVSALAFGFWCAAIGLISGALIEATIYMIAAKPQRNSDIKAELFKIAIAADEAKRAYFILSDSPFAVYLTKNLAQQDKPKMVNL